MSLSTQVLLGLGLGLAVGLFFGPLVEPLGVVGKAFILLLQMTVLPYMALALLKGLGSLDYAQARLLAVRAGSFIAVVWGLTLVAVLMIPFALPDWPAASFFSTSLVEEIPAFDFLGLFIPANPFEALSKNVVPAVVVFSAVLGIALIGIEGKEPVLRAASVLVEALGRITSGVVRLAPVGVFAIAAEAGGTLQLDDLKGLQVFVVAYILIALVLAFWALPGLVAALTPFRYREIVGLSRDALVTAFATGNVFVVLAVLTEKSKELVRLHATDAEEAEALAEVVVPIAYTLPSSGKLLALAFVPFAGWLSGFAVPLSQYPALAVVGLFTFFGNTLVAIPFLLDMFRIPADLFPLFVITDNVVGRFGGLLAAVFILVVTLAASSSVAGLMRWQPIKFARYAGITVALLLGTIASVRLGFEAIGHDYEGYERFIERSFLLDSAGARILDGPPEPLPAVEPGVPTLDRIRERGRLRVGYWKDALPWAFRNDHAELVGFSIELLHQLARDLDVPVDFVPVEASAVPHLLSAGYLDTALGLPVTPGFMEVVAFPRPYVDASLAFLVRDYRRDEFASREAIQAQSSIRVGVTDVPYYEEKLRRYLPQAELVKIESPRPFLRGAAELDAILVTAESGSAWSLVYPDFTVAVPQPDVLKVPLAFPVARGETEWGAFLSAWIDLKHNDLTIERLFDHWIRGRAEGIEEPRWSVIRNVLGWVE